MSAFKSNGKFAYKIPFDHFLAFRFHAAGENEFVIGIRTTKNHQLTFSLFEQFSASSFLVQLAVITIINGFSFWLFRERARRFRV